jgi:ABC-2 type transport system permease protein
MRNILALYKKELRSYFNSAVAYVVITVFLLIAGWFFATQFFLMGQATVRTVFAVIPWIFIVFVPAITMRAIAEEKKTGTIELLVTMPTRDWDIVLGKFLAVLTLLVIALAFTLVYAITASILGNLDAGATFAGYVGLILLGGAFLAIGMFASSTSENQIVAFIIGVVIIFVFYILDWVTVFVPGPVASILEFLSLNYHFNSIARGVIDSRDVIYYLSMTGFALVLSVRALESRKW